MATFNPAALFYHEKISKYLKCANTTSWVLLDIDRQGKFSYFLSYEKGILSLFRIVCSCDVGKLARATTKRMTSPAWGWRNKP